MNSLAISLPGRPPSVSVTFDNATKYCRDKGPGWHLMTNWEWAAIALWCVKNGFQPRGNTNYGRAHNAAWETAVRVDGRAIGEASGNGRSFGGGGPVSWRHNNTFQGIADLVGSVWERQGGLKIIDGQIYMPNDNNFNLAEADWPAQGVFFDATSTVNGAPVLSNEVSKTGENYLQIAGRTGWQQMTQSAGFASLSDFLCK